MCRDGSRGPAAPPLSPGKLRSGPCKAAADSGRLRPSPAPGQRGSGATMKKQFNRMRQLANQTVGR